MADTAPPRAMAAPDRWILAISGTATHRGLALTASVALFLIPALHPLLRGVVGVPSHLLWFVHVLPVAILSYAYGTRGAFAAVVISITVVSMGERLFGAGYWHGADEATMLALATAVGLTGLLVSGFSLAVRAGEAARLRQDEQLRRAQALSELGEAVASIAHEINNPLASVVAYADLLGAVPVLRPEDREDLAVMAREAQRAAGIARGLLARVRPGEAPRDPMDLNDLVSHALRARRPSFAAHHIRVIERLAVGLPQVRAARGEIEQVVTNLLANAEHAMYAARQSGTLTVRTRQNGMLAEIVLEDDGPGIAREHAARLFEPFFTTKPAGVGTGLGLAIARRIARAHGGDLRFASQPGAGALFALCLPVSPVPAEPATAVRPAPTPSGGRCRILVVDDEPAVRRVIERMLRLRGHTVITASTRAEADAAAQDGDWDVILCDVQLGDDDGLAFYRDVAARRPELAGRFVFMSGDLLNPALRAVLAGSGGRVLPKPFETAALLALAEGAA